MQFKFAVFCFVCCVSVDGKFYLIRQALIFALDKRHSFKQILYGADNAKYTIGFEMNSLQIT